MPSAPDRVLHDTWVFVKDDEVHLFYLAPQGGNNLHRLIGHAVSTDWLHWRELPFIELTGEAGAWDSGRIGTGCVFRYDDGRYYMAYTGRIDPQEDIGLAVSDDLTYWDKVTDRPVWPRARQAPYEADAGAEGMPPAWRDPYVVQTEAGEWVAYATARVAAGAPSARACVARARIDAIDRWTSLEPLAQVDGHAIMEVPEVFAFAGKWWITFNTHSGWGRRLDAASKEIAGGTFCLVADAPDGPWRQPEDSLLIGSGGGRRDAVVARSVEWRGERLVYHHFTGPVEAGSPRAMGLPKVLAARGERLYLRLWDGVRGLWTGALKPAGWAAPRTGPLAGGRWQVGGERITGSCPAGGGVCAADLGATDVDVAVRVTVCQGQRAGVAVGVRESGRDGLLVLLDAARDEAAIGALAAGSYGPDLARHFDRCRRTVEPGREYRLRILVRDRYAEAYLDDELVFCTIKGATGTGSGLACIVDSAAAEFHFEHAHALEPVPRPAAGPAAAPEGEGP